MSFFQLSRCRTIRFEHLFHLFLCQGILFEHFFHSFLGLEFGDRGLGLRLGLFQQVASPPCGATIAAAIADCFQLPEVIASGSTAELQMLQFPYDGIDKQYSCSKLNFLIIVMIIDAVVG